MNTRPGKIYGPSGLVIMTVALILLMLVAGIGIGFTRTKCGTVGREIKKLEDDRKELERTGHAYEELKAKANDILNLENAVKGKLQKPTDSQVVVVRRSLSVPRPAIVRGGAPDDPRFTALDIAFINAAPARSTAVR
jgi:hypothetical protein